MSSSKRSFVPQPIEAKVKSAVELKNDKGGKSSIFLTILLVLGCVTILFPLYMTIIIAFKSPSEMTNDINGALSLPQSFSFDNFAEAMRVTDFWHSLGNSIIITAATIILSLVIHSMAGYAIGRNMNRKKGFKMIYFYIVSGMFVPFAILMMPLVKQTANLGLDNMLGVIILYTVFYMPMNVMLYSGYMKNVPMAMEEAADMDGASAWRTYWTIIFPMMKPDNVTLPLAQLNFQTQFGTNYNLAFASYLLALLPIVIFYIICQKQIIGGVANGAVKG